MIPLTPGTYMKEKAAARPIPGVSTSTAAFIGIVMVDEVNSLAETVWKFSGTATAGVLSGYMFERDGKTLDSVATLKETIQIESGSIGILTDATSNRYNISIDDGALTAANVGATDLVEGELEGGFTASVPIAEAKTPVLVTSLNAYFRHFGELKPLTATASNLTVAESEYLAQTVKGFFDNGGTRCYVIRLTDWNDLDNALTALERVDEVSICALAAKKEDDTATKARQGKLLEHCQKIGDRFAVLNANYKVTSGLTVASVYEKSGADAAKAVDPNDQGAVYFPWLKTRSLATTTAVEARREYLKIAVPPCGHIAGVYARSDVTLGPHAAPANYNVRGVLGGIYSDGTNTHSAAFTDEDQGPLNQEGINVLREFNPGQVMVWGARTWAKASSQPAYVSTRRYMNYLKESIKKGTRSEVFQPNGQQLWNRLTTKVRGMLLLEWESGALAGATADEAFYVQCDGDLNHKAVVQSGQVRVQIGVALLYPAEFIMFSISQEAQAG